MKRAILCLLVLLPSLQSCAKKADNFEPLAPYFNEVQRAHLQKMLTHFDDMLSKCKPELRGADAYASYLSEFTEYPCFFSPNESTNLMIEAMQVGLFDKLFVLTSAKEIDASFEQSNEKDGDQMVVILENKMQGEAEEEVNTSFYIESTTYLDAMLAVCKDEELNDIFNSLKEIKGISPNVVAGGLAILLKEKPKRYNDELFRLNVAILAYYSPRTMVLLPG